MGAREIPLVSTSLIFSSLIFSSSIFSSLIFWILHIIPIYLLDDVFRSLFARNSNATSTESLELDSYISLIQCKDSHNVFIQTMGKFVVDCQLLALPSKESDHMATKDTFQDRSRELNVAIAIVKDVLESCIVLEWGSDNVKKEREKNPTAVVATATMCAGTSCSLQ